MGAGPKKCGEACICGSRGSGEGEHFLKLTSAAVTTAIVVVVVETDVRCMEHFFIRSPTDVAVAANDAVTYFVCGVKCYMLEFNLIKSEIFFHPSPEYYTSVFVFNFFFFFLNYVIIKRFDKGEVSALCSRE